MLGMYCYSDTNALDRLFEHAEEVDRARHTVVPTAAPYHPAAKTLEH